MWFDLGRSEGFPTQYAPHPTPVTVDVLEAGLVTAFVILALSFLFSLPTTRIHKNIFLFARVAVTLLIGLFLLLANFGQEWEVGHVVTKTPYKAGVSQEINASIAIKIGLRSVNVTLNTKSPPEGVLKKEIINYNERFEWTWDQGRFGFGPYAGHLQQEFRAAQYRGIPTPILWVVEYFVIDGEGFRFGRFYRLAGWYSHIALWTAFGLWIIANILFRSVITYGAYCLGVSGILQLTANLVWLVVRNPNPLRIPFEDGTIITKFGTSYWLTFFTGLVCLVFAVVILVMEYLFIDKLYTFFGIDPLNSYDELVYLASDEKQQLRSGKPTNDMPLLPMQDVPEENNDYDSVRYMWRRTIINHPPKIMRSNKPKHLLLGQEA